MIETRESVALGMREAEVKQLRSAIFELERKCRRMEHEAFLLENALKRIADITYAEIEPEYVKIAREAIGYND